MQEGGRQGGSGRMQTREGMREKVKRGSEKGRERQDAEERE